MLAATQRPRGWSVRGRGGAARALPRCPTPPRTATCDGRFRRSAGRGRSGRTAGLQARKGYLALRTAAARRRPPPEAPALARLDARGAPVCDVPVRVHRPAVSRRLGALGGCRSSSAVAGRDLSRAEDPRRGRLSAGLHDPRPRPRSGRARRGQAQPALPAVRPPRPGRGGAVGGGLFYRETRLPPGHYTLQAVVHDALADRAGAGTAELDLPRHRRAVCARAA